MIERLAFLVGVVKGLLGRGAPPADEVAPSAESIDPSRREVPRDPRAELIVAGLLATAGLCAFGFAVALALEAGTQVLGLALGGALAPLAIALILAGKRVVVQEVAVEERVPMVDPEAEADVARVVGSLAEGISRRRLLARAAGLAGCGLAAAVAVPAASLGPGAGTLETSPWRRGIRLVTTEGRPLRAEDIPLGGFDTAYPEGADPRELGSPVVVVHIEEGLRAFSKICTHAGCAVSLFRYPVSEPTSSGPALVCPCHYSTFDVRSAGQPVFGPAARALPSLPIAADHSGDLRALSGFSGSVGPSWWRVRRT
jgi:ubiquinol-cytochrome c reductase iron-sulfur subunit